MADALIKQGHRSYNENDSACEYFGEMGSCAVGHIIPKRYKKELSESCTNTCGISGLMGWLAVKREELCLIRPQTITTLNEEWLMNCQRVHDNGLKGLRADSFKHHIQEKMKGGHLFKMAILLDKYPGKSYSEIYEILT
jgi:hypothetical protein